MSWVPANKIAVALFNFTGQQKHHLSVNVGDLLYVLEEYPGWCRGYQYYQPSQKGIFPSSFVETREHMTQEIGGKPQVVPVVDSVAQEASEALKEWRSVLFDLYLTGRTSQKYQQLLSNMEEVLYWRTKILHSSATHDALQAMRTKLTAKIDQINNQLGCPLVPRTDKGEVLDCHMTSAQQLYKLHQDRKEELDHGVSHTGELQKKAVETSSTHIHHLFMSLGKIDHAFPEDVEIFFFLYDLENKGQVSERFILRQKVKSSSFQGTQTALFTDLGHKDINAPGMHLVCQIVRRGKMLLDDKKHISQYPFRRPYACGVLEVASVLKAGNQSPGALQEESSENYNMPLFLCAANHESDFATFHNKIIAKFGAKGGQKPGCAMALTLRALYGDLNQVMGEYSTRKIQVVHKLGFPDVILPGDVRNDIYVTLEHGQFEKGSKRAERNVEVAINVMDGAGKVIPRSIMLGAGVEGVSEYESFIFYHNNTPKWQETFKLSIPFKLLPDAHLRITFRHVAKNENKEKAEKTFSFTYLKIMKEDGSIIRDGIHELYVYKAEGKRWSDPKVYLTQPSCKDDVLRNRDSKTFGSVSKQSVSELTSVGGSCIARSFRETIHVSTLICSTKLTQKIELLMLLKWRTRERNLAVVLHNLTNIGGEEVVKFLQDTLDCLFDILNTDSSQYGERVFDVLVSIFEQMQNEKYQHFTTVLDIYIAKHFSAILAHKFLIWCFDKHIRDYGHVHEMQAKLIRVLKSMRYVFRFMVQSHTLYVRHNNSDDQSFTAELVELFNTLCTLMTYQENKVKQVYLVQSVVLANLPSVLPDVVQVLPETQLASLISKFLDSMRNTYGTLPKDKLQFILDLLNAPVKLLATKEARRTLIPTMVGHLTTYISTTMPVNNFRPEDISHQLCMRCVGCLLEMLADSSLGVEEEDIELGVPLILPLLRLCKQIPQSNPLHKSNLINLIGLLDVMQDIHYATFFDGQKSFYENALKDFIMDFMQTLKVIIKTPLFPKDWVSMFLIQARVIARALENISKSLLNAFLAVTVFNPQIWDHYFGMCTEYLTQPFLQLEQYSPLRRHRYILEFADMRVTVGHHMILMWHKLGEQKANFIPDLIGSFLELTLLRPRELRRHSLPMLLDMMKCEHFASGNFKRVETEVFDKMDDLLYKGRGDEDYKEMFADILTAKCSEIDVLAVSGPPFIDTVSRLIALLLDYRSVSTEDKGRRMGCMFNLLNFYKEIDKQELYVRYIYKLAELHEKDKSFTEAGYTLLLHAEALEWSHEEPLLVAIGKYPEQTSHQRKEQLYRDAIDLFDQGHNWETGIPLCKQLATLYETDLFDYEKLSAMLQREAQFFVKIIRELRVEPEYFMVGYYGRGFPLFLRNKIFIHRGQTYERLGSFIKRLTDEFSTAQILKTHTPPGDEIRDSNGMYLQVRSVQPITEQHEHFKGKQVPDKIAEYYKTNEVQRFTYDRPFHKGKKNKDCEFATLWLERTKFSTSNSFPGVISWFEVTDIDTVEMSPLEIALETVESKNREIHILTGQYNADKTLNINPLSMLLNGVIDAAVMGGIANYEKIFFNEMYTKENPAHTDGVKKLRALIEEQIVILEKGLALHKQRIVPSLQGLHDKLEKCFEDVQCIVYPERRRKTSVGVQRSQTMAIRTSSTLARPLPPTPFDKQGSSPPQPQSTKTLPNKKIIRRATGVPSKMKVIAAPLYEDTDIKEKPSAKNQVNRRTSTPVVHSQSPSHPSPRLSHGPSPPSPYSSRKRSSRSPSSGGSSENLTGGVIHERRSLEGSGSRGSLNRISDDDEHEAYEPIEDFLLGRPDMVAKETPPPQQQQPVSNQSDHSPVINKRASTAAPKYPAPPPPSAKDRSDSIDDDGYEPVQLAGRTSETGFVDDVDRVVLPLTPSSFSVTTLVGGGLPVSKPKPKERSPSTPEKTLTSNNPSTDLSTSLPEKKVSRRVLMPPEPTSPPPSPPTGRDAMSPSTPTTSPLLSQQPKLPPKQRKKAASLTTSSNQDDDIYAFDRLSPPPSAPNPSNQTGDEDVYSFDRLSPPPQSEPVSDEVYFDHLVSGRPQIPPKKSAPKPVPKSAGGVKNESEVALSASNQGEVYFDHLVSGPPSTTTMSTSSTGEDEVYFDHLVSGEPPQQPQPTPRRMTTGQRSSNTSSSNPMRQVSVPGNPTGQQDDVYFDHLFEDGGNKPPVLSRSLPQREWPPSSNKSDSSSAPPLPLKKRNTIVRRTSENVDGTPTTPDHPTPPVPRPRTNTLERKKLSETDPAPPVLPPKPSNPTLPPKPGKPAAPLPPKQDTKPPPLPVKPTPPPVASRWPPANKK